MHDDDLMRICANLFEQSDDLLELCAREFERFVDELFLSRRESGLALCRAPIIDRLYDAQSDADTARIRWMLHSAVRARQHFRQHGPPGAPLLPLTFDAIERAEHDPNNRIELVGHYASSLMLQQWNLKLHPSFHDYASGVMAYRYTPDYLRNNAELLQEFPPRPLEGLDKALNWRTLDDITQQRQDVIRMLEHYRELADANWLQGATSELAELSQVYPSKFAQQ